MRVLHTADWHLGDRLGRIDRTHDLRKAVERVGDFCRTLTHAMNLAAPTLGEVGELVQPGRLYLATEPTLLRLKDRRDGFDVQFVLMPYPTPTRYLRDEAAQRYASPEEKNQRLMTAFREALRTIRGHERFDSKAPTVLAAHVNVSGATVG